MTAIGTTTRGGEEHVIAALAGYSSEFANLSLPCIFRGVFVHWHTEESTEISTFSTANLLHVTSLCHVFLPSFVSKRRSRLPARTQGRAASHCCSGCVYSLPLSLSPLTTLSIITVLAVDIHSSPHRHRETSRPSDITIAPAAPTARTTRNAAYLCTTLAQHLAPMEDDTNTDSAAERLVECSVCGEMKPRDATSVITTSEGNHTVCHDYIRHLFDEALKFEFKHPPSFGSHVLELQRFVREGVLSQEFVTAYAQKQREDNCLPQSRRIYCLWPAVPTLPPGKGKGKAKVEIEEHHQSAELCQIFLDKKRPSILAPRDLLRRNVVRNDGFFPTVICPKCQNPSCCLCGGRFSYGPMESPHQCIPQDTDDTTFKDLKRGRDFQICPSKQCGRRMQLLDGCNHITCKWCRTQFYYICGEAILGKGDHWKKRRGGCPRWNQSGTEDARFDG